VRKTQTVLWTAIDDLTELPPPHLPPEDQCVYARVYRPGQSYGGGPGNQAIYNLKMRPSVKTENPKQWYYRERAVQQFATELFQIVDDGTVVIRALGSKPISHPEYSDAIEQALAVLVRLNHSVRIEAPVVLTQELPSAKLGGIRNPWSLREYYEWVGFQQVPRSTVIVDDVVTTGGHYRALRDIIAEHHPGIELSGAFWARTVHDR
jgi:hypothetical protein